jgi:hypothetical protein
MKAFKNLTKENLHENRLQKRIEFLETEREKLIKLFKIVNKETKITAGQIMPFLREEDIVNFLLTSADWRVEKYTKVKIKDGVVKEYFLKRIKEMGQADFQKITLKERGNNISDLLKAVEIIFYFHAYTKHNDDTLLLALDLLKGKES